MDQDLGTEFAFLHLSLSRFLCMLASLLLQGDHSAWQKTWCEADPAFQMNPAGELYPVSCISLREGL